MIGIRELTDADLSFVMDLLNAEILGSPYVYAESSVTLAERAEWLATHRRLGLPVLLAHDPAAAGRALGWASLSPYRASSGYRFTVEASVYVAAEARGRGIAAALVRALEKRAIASGRHAVAASVDAGNAGSLRLFDRLGYEEVGRLPEVGRKFGEWRTQVLMLRRLEGRAEGEGVHESADDARHKSMADPLL